MNWKAFLSFIAQHAIQGALVAGAGMGVSGHSPFSVEGLTVMGAGALVSAGNHLRNAPGWNAEQ